jgi:hypothetical protein
MRLVLGSKARELYQSLDVVLEPQKPGKAAAQQVSPCGCTVCVLSLCSLYVLTSELT